MKSQKMPVYEGLDYRIFSVIDQPVITNKKEAQLIFRLLKSGGCLHFNSFYAGLPSKHQILKALNAI